MPTFWNVWAGRGTRGEILFGPDDPMLVIRRIVRTCADVPDGGMTQWRVGAEKEKGLNPTASAR
ncbi:hypothetical protein AB0L14_24970 [Streptomyces sp. NPDC052727]|uniref:hypothetical protein n=1 Tax=Streptomyces sp. NPDC052727 TaxID=3154854 RepID=UPI003446F117